MEDVPQRQSHSSELEQSSPLEIQKRTIRNLDTGEELLLDDLEAQEEPYSAGTALQAGQLPADKSQKKKSWLKSTKHGLKKWAKTHLMVGHDKSQKSIDSLHISPLEHQTRSTHRPSLQGSEQELPATLPLQQDNQLPGVLLPSDRGSDQSVASTALAPTSEHPGQQHASGLVLGLQSTIAPSIISSASAEQFSADHDADGHSTYSDHTETLKTLPAKPILNTPVKVSTWKSTGKLLHQVKLIQMIPAHDGVIWAAALSADGRFLATGGQDAVVRLWELAVQTKGIMIKPTDFDAHSDLDSSYGPPELAHIIRDLPISVLEGHTEDVLDVAWSAGSFLLSASADNSVRLWHAIERECLRVFNHPDIVTSVQFHPQDHRKFVSGCMDGVMRIWSITEEDKILCSTTLHQDQVTAVTFSQEGSRVVAGTMRGKVRFYGLHDHKLDYVAQLDAKNQHGPTATGKKVTSIQAIPHNSEKFLVSSNDSRIRLSNGYAWECKFKGHKNGSTQIHALCDASGNYVLSASDDGRVYIWELTNTHGSSQATEKNSAYEYFQTADTITTVALLAPEACRRCAPDLPPPGVPNHQTEAAFKLGSKEASHSSAANTFVDSSKNPLYGALFLVVGFSGKLLVYENT